MEYVEYVQEAIAESEDACCPRCGSVDDLVKGKNSAKLYCPHCGVARALVKVESDTEDVQNVKITVTVLKVKSSKNTKHFENNPIGFGRGFLLGMTVTLLTSGLFYVVGMLYSQNPSQDFGFIMAWLVTGTIISLVVGMIAGMENSRAW